MSNDEIQEEQDKKEAANAENDMDSLMDELEEQQNKPENIEDSEAPIKAANIQKVVWALDALIFLIPKLI